MDIVKIALYALSTFVFIQVVAEMAAMKAEMRIIKNIIKFLEANREHLSIEVQEEK